MSRIVTFGPNGARIYEGANPKNFKGQTFLINPTLPRGIPPHLWKLVDGKIEGAPEKPEEAVEAPVWIYTLVGFILGFALRCLF
jgi:hypothetical protein